MRYMCDFETTSGEAWLQKDGCVRVWAFACCTICDNPKVTQLGNNIDEFMKWLLKGNKQVYFHNLAYDGEYIISWLFKNKYKYTDDTRKM